MGRLLPHQRQAGRQPGQSFEQQRLRFAVGNGDRIVAALVLDLAVPEVAIAWQDHLGGDLAAQRQDRTVEHRHDR
jgi:hypothetical protein